MTGGEPIEKSNEDDTSIVNLGNLSSHWLLASFYFYLML